MKRRKPKLTADEEKARLYKNRLYYVNRVYGLSEEEYVRLWGDGCCDVCGVYEDDAPNQKLHIDHDHVTGVVRGMLCSNCNSALGFSQDSSEILAGLITYLGGDPPLDSREEV